MRLNIMGSTRLIGATCMPLILNSFFYVLSIGLIMLKTVIVNLVAIIVAILTRISKVFIKIQVAMPIIG